jgi:hypothetical protein
MNALLPRQAGFEQTACGLSPGKQGRIESCAGGPP